MEAPSSTSVPSLRFAVPLFLWFVVVVSLHLWAVTRGWTNLNLPGNEFRQTQTALSATYIQKDRDFSLEYPTPVLGKPWSVPFEFPLYQWTAVGVSEATGWPLVTAGRLVSVACFYLALPALWLLLGTLRVARAWRWGVIGFVLLCPIHVFYARAFLIETMALLFALWFLAAFGLAMERRGWGWIAIANLAGLCAGLVKVTTFAVVLMPAAVAFGVILWREWRGAAGERGRRLVTLIGCGFALVTLPLAGSVAWVRFADAVKARNPAAQFATSGNLRDFNFGSWTEHLDPALWGGQAANILQGVAGPAVLALGVLLLIGARGRRGLTLAFLGTFAAPLLVFPVLYKVHEYYFMANATFLAAGLGLATVSLLGRRGWRWLGLGALVAVPVLQSWSYWRHYAEWQAQPNPPGSQLTEILPKVTDERDVLIVSGYDWNATIPFYTGRRALMFHGGSMDNRPLVEASYAALAGERIGALVLSGAQRVNRVFLDLTLPRFGLDPRPLFSLGDDDVYVPIAMRPSALQFLRTVPVAELRLPPPEADETSWWRERVVPVSALPPLVRRNFRGFDPEPLRCQATFDYSSAEVEGKLLFSMHPVTRLWFRPPAEHCHLETSCLIYAEAYEGKAPGERTDGVRFALYEEGADGARRLLYERLLDPAAQERDRGRQVLGLDLDLKPGSVLLLETTAGEAGNWAYDWAALGPLTLRSRAAP
jgi:hypothetical protein